MTDQEWAKSLNEQLYPLPGWATGERTAKILEAFAAIRAEQVKIDAQVVLDARDELHQVCGHREAATQALLARLALLILNPSQAPPAGKDQEG
jgi:hypothetical protein